MATTPKSIRLTEELDEEVRRTAAETGLSEQDVIRLALRRGLPLLMEALAVPVPETREEPQPA